MVKKLYNYNGHEVVYSFSADCPKEFKSCNCKYNPVFDNIESLAKAMEKLDSLREQIKQVKGMRFFEYSSYILKISHKNYSLTFKCYVI